MYISTLRKYVEAIGGELELTVRLRSRPPMRLRQLADVGSEEALRRPRTARTGRGKVGRRLAVVST